MCGIVGVKANSFQVSTTLIVGMRDTFVYRGPDDQGAWVDEDLGIGLGHRRLSIIDTTPRGRQPLLDRTSGRRIVFNGEIYNFVEIRNELEQRGVQFSTATDTEVILKAYDAYGFDCVNAFNGMFAFAIWDPRNRAIFLARDRLGIKPLYYYLDPDLNFYFASEVKAIKKVLGRRLPVRTELIDKYMSFGYVPGSETMNAGIKRLLPGHYAVFSDGALDTRRYWQLKHSCTTDAKLGSAAAAGLELLGDAVKLRLRSDVPLGVFLSGGLDSSAVVAAMAQQVDRQIKTFSIAYDFGKEFDETCYAQQVSAKFNTDHQEIYITPAQFRDFVPEFAHLMDEPVAESAATSLFFVSRLAKDDVTVVLSGEGSDEIFAGYDFYRYNLIMDRIRSMIGSKGAATLGKLSSLSPIQNKLTKYMGLTANPVEKRYKGLSTYDEQAKQRLYRPDFIKSLQHSRVTEADAFIDALFAEVDGCSTLEKMLHFDIRTWLVDDLLIKADRMSMAASIELRVPFLDHRMVEFAASLPNSMKISGNQGKWILKHMMRKLLPAEIIERKKMGFPTPMKIMLEGDLAGYARDMLTSNRSLTHEYFCKESVARMLGEHENRIRDHHRQIWQLIVL